MDSAAKNNAPTSAVPDSAAESATDELTALRKEVQELRDKSLRALADARNSQQRAQRERAEALRYAEGDFARELLTVLDGLEQTQQSAATAMDVKSVADGVRIVHEQFLKALKARGIEPIAALGEPFDPHWHEAILQESSDAAPGTVTRELQRGYRMHDRVIRASRVAVAKPTDTAEKLGE